jgi:hypothetical protein
LNLPRPYDELEEPFPDFDARAERGGVLGGGRGAEKTLKGEDDVGGGGRTGEVLGDVQVEDRLKRVRRSASSRNESKEGEESEL